MAPVVVSDGIRLVVVVVEPSYSMEECSRLEKVCPGERDIQLGGAAKFG